MIQKNKFIKLASTLVLFSAVIPSYAALDMPNVSNLQASDNANLSISSAEIAANVAQLGLAAVKENQAIIDKIPSYTLKNYSASHAKYHLSQENQQIGDTVRYTLENLKNQNIFLHNTKEADRKDAIKQQQEQYKSTFEYAIGDMNDKVNAHVEVTGFDLVGKHLKIHAADVFSVNSNYFDGMKASIRPY